MKWIPREQNADADYLSKIKDFDDSINNAILTPPKKGYIFAFIVGLSN